MTTLPEVPSRILLVGDEAVALAGMLRAHGYDTCAAQGLDRLEDEFRASYPDAAVVSAEGRAEAVAQAIRRLRQIESFRHVPVIVLARRELLDGPLAEAFSAMSEGLLLPLSEARLKQRLRANLEVRRMLELGEKRAQRLMALVEISHAVNSTLDSGAILYIIARKIGETMELGRCSFIVPDLQNGLGHVIACKDDPNISSLEINLANYPEIIQVLRSGRRVVIDDVETDPIMAGIRKFADVFRGQSIMTLPLDFHGEIIGVLQIRKKGEGRGFSEREIEYCELLAAAAASALKNAQLYEDIERHNNELRRQKRELEQLSGELRRKNEELVALQQLKEDFTTMLVHDLRSPLMIVQGVLDLLDHRALLRDDDKDLVRDGIGVTKKILSLIESLLEVSRLESGEMQLHAEPLDLGQLALASAEPLKPLAAARRVRLEVSAGEELPLVHGDRRGLTQVVDNLLANALKFTPEGGCVALTLTPDGEGVQLVCEDTGEGIAPEDLPHIFKRFHQGQKRGRKGTGLGLAIVDLMVRAHGGDVRVESQVDRGSRFVVRIPARGARVKPGPRALAGS